MKLIEKIMNRFGYVKKNNNIQITQGEFDVLQELFKDSSMQIEVKNVEKTIGNENLVGLDKNGFIVYPEIKCYSTLVECTVNINAKTIKLVNDRAYSLMNLISLIAANNTSEQNDK